MRVLVIEDHQRLAKLIVEGRVIGLLRSHAKGGGSAAEGPACATVLRGDAPLVTLCVPEHSVAGGENLSVRYLRIVFRAVGINDHRGDNRNAGRRLDPLRFKPKALQRAT